MEFSIGGDGGEFFVQNFPELNDEDFAAGQLA